MIVVVEDSPDARLFIELSSHASDLAEARAALDLAIQGEEGDGPLADASAFLIGFAVVAYCRTILHSNVRRVLTEHIDIPADLAALNELVRTFRNATIAHSQSELSVTYPVGVLDPETLQVRDLAAATVVNTLPWPVVHEFRSFVDTLEELLDELIAPVRQRLRTNLDESDRSALIATRSELNVVHLSADEFNPRSRRSPYPTSHTLYWSQIENPD